MNSTDPIGLSRMAISPTVLYGHFLPPKKRTRAAKRFSLFFFTAILKLHYSFLQYIAALKQISYFQGRGVFRALG